MTETEEEFTANGDSPIRSDTRRRRRRLRPRWITAIFGFVFLLIPLWFILPGDLKEPWISLLGGSEEEEEWEVQLPSSNINTSKGSFGIVLPQILMDEGVYHSSDFENKMHISPPYWNFTTPLFQDTTKTWGPCFIPKAKIKWKFNKGLNEESNLTINVPLVYRRNDKTIRHNWQSLQGLCRPGFLILGAGKCGTSSLYHYLVGHPRVLPAIEKQIHYYRYHASKPLGWYLAWFPTTETFLENAALMTGEASPGYLPYPKVVRQISKSPIEPKLITVGRNPIDRIWSSYKYNYISPALNILRRGGVGKIPGHKSDEYYTTNHLFTLDELVRAELTRLQKCLYGFGINKTRDIWYSKKWTTQEFDYRQENGLDPLIDLDEVCYGKQVNNTVLREQWASLQMSNPEKFIPPKQAFLIQAIIGRSLYVFPLEWWYIEFHKDDLLFVCTEELNNATTLLNLARKLGLPDHDFEQVIAQGAYNVGGNRGYDTATSWQELQNETISNSQSENPLSDKLFQELKEFLEPINERLFDLVGERCSW